MVGRRGPVLIAVLSALLRWPDRSQALGYFEGFNFVGSFPKVGIFKEIGPDELPEGDIFGPSAREMVQTIARSAEPPDADRIAEVTAEEQAKGFCGPPLTHQQLDAIYGEGLWRPMVRCVIHQGDKDRLIDDARRGGHNEWSSFSETIFTIGADYSPETARALLEAFLRSEGVEPKQAKTSRVSALPEWAALEVGADDLPGAYRGCPVSKRDQGANVFAYFDPEARGWRFRQMIGGAFGPARMVLTFNHFPVLGCAACRRVCAVPVGAYYDDLAVVDSAAARGSGRE